jgi:hypothetical protein
MVPLSNWQQQCCSDSNSDSQLIGGITAHINVLITYRSFDLLDGSQQSRIAYLFAGYVRDTRTSLQEYLLFGNLKFKLAIARCPTATPIGHWIVILSFRTGGHYCSQADLLFQQN